MRHQATAAGHDDQQDRLGALSFSVHMLHEWGFGNDNGIRNTGMPAWGSMLSDDEIWQLVSLLKNLQDLPPSVEAEWSAPTKKGTQ